MSPGTVAPPLLAALRERAAALPADRIDRVWLFPARRLGPADSSLAVVSLLATGDPDGPRTILTLHCTSTATRGGSRNESQLVEHGSAPADRVDNVIRGVLRRLRDTPEEPHVEEILGCPERWSAFLDGDARG